MNNKSNGKSWLTILLALVLVLLQPFVACGGNFYAGTSPSNVPWSGGIVPYEFTNTLTASQQQTYLDGLREWQLAANVQFVPHTTEMRWILFTYNTNDIDNVASGYSPQVVTVSSLSRSQVCHEMGHSFGFTHENIRPDAADFIMVLTNNIYNESSNIISFTINPNSVPHGPYDFESVMHLHWDFESTQQGVLATQQPTPPYFSRYQFRMGNFCLSPGDRAAIQYLYGPAVVPLTNIVTSTADVGPGSLRAAIYYATDHPGSIVRFNIPTNDPGYSNGVFNIYLTGYLPPLVTNGMIIDGSTQPGFTNKPIIILDGSKIVPQTFVSTTLLIYSGNNQVKDISFAGFNWNGLTLQYAEATNNTINGCWLGLDSTGHNAAPNVYQGILIFNGASGNIIGGTNVLSRNVISGNLGYGIFISDSNTTGNVVVGNFLGTDASGANAVPNGYSGVFVGNGASGNIIGGTNVLSRNVISGNLGYGIFISDSNTTGNVVGGNFLGTDASGANAVPNGYCGVFVGNGANGNMIGGTAPSARNVISGNSQVGIFISDSNTTGNVVAGNFLGTDASGANAVPNGNGGIVVGNGASGNIIGGTNALARNVISGNTNYGVFIGGVGTISNTVEGNVVGLNAAGNRALPNTFAGMYLLGGTQSNLVMNNIFSGQSSEGLRISDNGTSGNVIQGNFFGTDATGMYAVPNGLAGLTVFAGAASNIIGGTTPSALNVISGNYYGLVVSDPGTSGNLIQGNLVGTDITGWTALPNGFAGLAVLNAASSNIIGGTEAGTANIISGNATYGLFISDTNTSGNLFQGNLIGTSATGTNALGNGFANIELQNGASGNFIGGIGAGNTIAFSGTGPGVVLYNTDTTNNSIRGNSIFSNGYLGINFNNAGVAVNHTGILAGPNDLQNFPVITNASCYAASTIILGTLNSLADSAFFIDVYRNAAFDPSGFGQGQVYVGTVSVTTDDSGNASFAYTNSSGNYARQYFTATATSAGGDTSEFSADLIASNKPVPFAQFVPPFGWRTNGFVFGLAVQTNFNYQIEATTNLGANPILWVDLTNFTPTSSSLIFTDRDATNYRARFYHIVSQ